MNRTREFLARTASAPAAGGRADAGDTIVATDGELLMRFARHRDHRAFAQIVERHGGLVWIVCREVLGHHQDVEDAFQATFFILATRAHTIRSSDSAAAWLCKVAQRTSLAARRKRSSRREEDLPAEEIAADVKFAELPDRELIGVLLEELRNLPERYQVPIMLRYFESHSRRAIAECTDLTIAQVQGRLARGRRLLRSRMLRRGVSLTYAAGAVVDLSTEANAKVTPAMAAWTAKNCLSIKNSGTASEASAVAIWLAHQGAKAMWFTSMMKTVAAISAVLAVAAIAWAVEAGDGAGAPSNKGDREAAQIELDRGAAKSGASLVNGERAGEMGRFFAGRFKYKVPVEIGQTEFKDGGRIEIEEIWGTRPKIEVGGQYIVRGKYTLPPGEKGRLYFYETSNGQWGREPTSDVDLQKVDLDKETGEFTLVHGMMGPGSFHLYLASPDKYSHYFANVYFRTVDNGQREQEAAPRDNAANAGAATAAEPTPNVQIAAAPAASDSDQPKGNQETVAKKQEEQAARERAYQQVLRKRADALMDMLTTRIQDKAKLSAKLEMQQLDRKLLERRIEKLSDTLADLQSPASVDNTTHSPDKRAAAIKETDEQLATTKATKLKPLMDQSAQLAAEIEHAQLLINENKQQIEELQRMNSQLEIRQIIPPAAGQQQLMSNRENSTGKLEASDNLHVSVVNAFADQPIDGNYPVESMGTVALGPTYGRVEVRGLTVLEAEQAIKKHLGELIENPIVQVTMSERQPSVQETEQLRGQIGALRAENASLKKQLTKK
ncbi:MAG TPA: sigma-70 family RNA polymerase sigma factor, partial [Lacipirellulaceae bacterium]|nr:sigma-70 family RNA polymerase sigma factor [Lacipirellulaceae bacterium]